MDNDYSWNMLANMLYVEIPSGVGFSFSETTSDYRVCSSALRCLLVPAGILCLTFVSTLWCVLVPSRAFYCG